MAIAVVDTKQGQAAGAGSLTISGLAVSGTNRAILLLATSIANDRFTGASNPTWNTSSGMGSPILSYWDGATGNASMYGWLLTAPAEATANIVLPCNNASSFANAVAFALAGVDQSTPVSASATPFNNTFATSPRSLALTIPADGAGFDLIYCATAGAAPAPTSPQVAAGATMVNSGVWSIRGSYLLGADTSMDWTFSGGTQAIVHAAIALNAAAGGGGGLALPPLRNRRFNPTFLHH